MTYDDARETNASQTFPVSAGQVYELRALVQAHDAASAMATTPISLVFYDEAGQTVDPRLAVGMPALPGWDQPQFELAPAGSLSDAARAAAEIARFVIAPPDAARAVLELQTNAASFAFADLTPVSASWFGPEGKNIARAAARIAQMRETLTTTALADPDLAAAWQPLLHLASQQADTLCDIFTTGGNWSPVAEQLSDPKELDEHDTRLTRLRSDAQNPPRVGFIGSPRGREKLMGMADIIWLRETNWRDQLAYLDLELVIIEAANSSGAGDDTHWQLAFSSLEGTLPDLGRALFSAAQEQSLPIHLWFTGDCGAAPMWREAAEHATKVIAEGPQHSWGSVQPGHFSPITTEPASVSLAHLGQRPDDLMLVPVTSDIFQFPQFNALVNLPSLYANALCEVDYEFDTGALANRLSDKTFAVFPRSNRAQQRKLYQSARIVLLSAQSIRSEIMLARIALDAIAAGAIPVLFGQYSGEDEILSRLDMVYGADDLTRLQALWRVPWLRERRWRNLHRHVMRHHVMRSADRTALLGRDPFAGTHDMPKISVVTPTMRPHLLASCLKRFRRQTWPEKELIMVLNTGEIPPDLPPLEANEHIFALPPSSPIGECLNRGIHHATGRYWAKMDDDDFYSAAYLEETVYAYRSTQADVVGGQSVCFYFSGSDYTQWRGAGLPRSFSLFQGTGHISGATLTGDKQYSIPLFPITERNSVDSSWVFNNVRGGSRVYSGGMSMMVAYRDADETRHTWKMSSVEGIAQQLSDLCAGNIMARLETGVQKND